MGMQTTISIRVTRATRCVTTSMGAALCLFAAAACDSKDKELSTAPPTSEARSPRAERMATERDGGTEVTRQEHEAGKAVAIPDTPAGMQLQWLLVRLNSELKPIEPEEVDEHFSDEFLRAIPRQQVVGVLSDVANSAPLSIIEIGTESATQLVALISTNAEPVLVTLGVDDRGLINLLSFEAGPSLEERIPATWEQIDANLDALAPKAAYLVATADECDPLRSRHADDTLAIGSTFKLYVLGATAMFVGLGDFGWNSEITIEEQLKSLPSGTLQDARAGSKVTVRNAAEAMISISDNTATDHLLHFIGRERAETPVQGIQYVPEASLPLLSTREFFLFKLDLSPNEVATYASGTVPQRRAILDALAGKAPSLEAASTWTQPRYVESIEWFANAHELCQVMKRLNKGPEGQVVAEILSKNPGLPIDREAFPYVGFKGGSEPGVLQLTWLVRDAAGRGRFIALTLNDSSKPIADEQLAFSTALGMFKLLANEVYE